MAKPWEKKKQQEDEEEGGTLAIFVFDYGYDHFLDLSLSSGAIAYCRICHEAEFESSRVLESPCACSGTSKFAHRDCIQRWCDEKGNTTCEICLQSYEPDYAAAAPLVCKKPQLFDARSTTFGDSLQVPRSDTPGGAARGFPVDEDEDYECAASADRAVSYCRSFALTFTVFLLLRHAIDVLSGKPEEYPFTLLTVLVLRMSGIIIPMFVVFWTITAVQNRMRRRSFRVVAVEGLHAEEEEEEEEDDYRQHQHIV
ncbi:hypothetical protein MLD38_025117 [Melastoma candidum]|uniref:Uncharacterized protein n=1 Tax=Melastoma candidum TaxID=119954 RepID=A0ACB9NUA7_9MYRT|nr:hypothetical protein MLD38_025117 [Melastoma candidum]